MRDGFKSIEIEPVEGYIDFIGPAKPDDSSRVLKGQLKFVTTKSIKIRNISVKFKGFSHITIQTPHQLEISTPLLPKLKQPILNKVTLAAGEHVLPWELDIPNIYPRSLMIKRATIHYKVIVSISIGLTRTVTAEYPIVIRRHLLPYKELAPIIETKLYTRTVPGKFHYEIDIPQIVCIEQDFIPLAIKYISFANQKPVQSVRTRLIQVELYRRNNMSKGECDLSTSNRDSQILDIDQKIMDPNQYKETHVKYIKKTVPGLNHIPDTTVSAWKRPSLVKHKLQPYLSFTLDSPLVSIYHQLEVTFQFGMKYEEIKVKIPIIIASIPKETDAKVDHMMMKYAFEELGTDYLPSKLEHHGSKQPDETVIGDRNEDDAFSMTYPDHRARSPVDPYTRTMSPPPLADPYTRTMSPPPVPSMSMLRPEEDRTLKKYASAFDLSTASEDSINRQCLQEDRPRTTTPTAMRRQQPQPINIDLANGHYQQQQFKTNTMAANNNTASTTLNNTNKTMKNDTVSTLDIGQILSSNNSSDVLPAADRVASRNTNNRKNKMYIATNNNTYDDDLKSIYSETSVTSATNAPSLSSSATLSTNKSHPTLHSRPPSPVFSPAPGLPGSIALFNTQEQHQQQVEELFNTVNSPTTNTVASSTLLSPRTSYALRRRIALSTISSLTNDSLSLGPSFLSPTRTNSDEHRYMNARLPPIPPQASKRQTKIYVDDSDDEDEEQEGIDPNLKHLPLPPLPTASLNEPPKLPRLSFGGDFGISLGI